MGVSPLGSGFAGLRYRFGASTSLTAAPTIPNALRHPNNAHQTYTATAPSSMIP
ncbi:MAG: hypothetical protein JNM36_14755 [Chitinophagales bacterium]|nr:hypothetical protein [Chitinophagales bacterium]